MKKLTTLFVLLALFSLLTTSGCWLEKKGETDEAPEMTDEEIAEEIEETEVIVPSEDLEEAIDSLTEIITNEESEASDCAYLGDEDLQQACEQTFVYRAAVESGDETRCEELLNEYDIESCKEEASLQ